MYQRNILRKLNAALADTRVVLLNGARQVGKTTLAQQLAQERGGRYLTLDGPGDRRTGPNRPFGARQRRR